MRYIIYIATSAICILFPIICLIYIYWDFSQPKTGPVGNGIQPPSVYELMPLFGTFLLGILNLPVAITRYKKHQKNPQTDSDASQVLPQSWGEQGYKAASKDNSHLQEAKKIIFALEAEIRRKRRNAQVYIEIEPIDDADKEKDSETVIHNFLNRFEAFKTGFKLSEIDEPSSNKLLEYVLTKQMAHGLEVMSEPEAQSIIRDFLGLFDSAERKIFTNGTYNNGLLWRSMMKESRGIIYFDTGAVVVTNDLIGILWLADKG